LLALCGAVVSALVIIYLKEVSQKLHNSVTNFYLFLGSLIISPIWSFVQKREQHPDYSL